MKRRNLLAAVVAACLATLPLGALAQGYPGKPITVIVPFAPAARPMPWRACLGSAWAKRSASRW